jgi:ferredoxin-type protein NapH
LKRIREFILTVIFFIILIGGWINPLLGYFIPICMAAGIGSGYFYGRKWCAKACPRGGFYDLCSGCSCHKKAPGFFSDDPFKIFILALMAFIMVIGIIFNWGDVYKIGHVFVILITVTTVIGVMLGVYFNTRIWCYFCPIGSISGWLGKLNRKMDDI